MKLDKKLFIPVDEGTWRGVCVDVTPLVKRDTKFGVQEEFRIVFETDAPEREGEERQCVWSRGFTPSLGEQANLRKFLRQWFGRDLTAAEKKDMDSESLVGLPATLVIVHAPGKEAGVIYANIAACTPYRGNDPLAPSGKFVRKKDYEANGEAAGYRKAATPDTDMPKGAPVDNTQAGADWTTVKVHVGKHAGVELRDLDQTALETLISKWLPIHKEEPKPTADDGRLAAALGMAKEYLEQLTQTQTDY